MTTAKKPVKKKEVETVEEVEQVEQVETVEEVKEVDTSLSAQLKAQRVINENLAKAKK